MNQHPKWVEFMQEQFPSGTRIRLTEKKNSDNFLQTGSEGTVDHVDDQCRLHIKWDNGKTVPLMPGEDWFSVIPQPCEILKLYMPLTINAYERNEWGDLEDEPYELDGSEVLVHEDSILAAIKKERMPEEAKRGLMTYYGKDDAVNRKVQSYVFTVEQVNGRLMGVAECRIRENLTGEELNLLKEDITGQAADGFGEGLEQRPIKTDDGEIYVSLWSSEKSWSIVSRDELEENRPAQGIQLE